MEKRLTSSARQINNKSVCTSEKTHCLLTDIFLLKSAYKFVRSRTNSPSHLKAIPFLAKILFFAHKYVAGDIWRRLATSTETICTLVTPLHDRWRAMSLKQVEILLFLFSPLLPTPRNLFVLSPSKLPN